MTNLHALSAEGNRLDNISLECLTDGRMPTERFARDVEYIPGRFSLRRVYDEMAKWTRFKQIQRKFGGAKSGDPSGCAVIYT